MEMEAGRREVLFGNLERVRREIADAAGRVGRDPEGVRLVAVTKGRDLADILAIWEAGVRDLGENRVQELAEKAEALAGRGLAPTWHMIGYLQRNKVKALSKWCRIIHSIDRAELGEELAKRTQGIPMEVLLEVNVSGEASKAGVAPAEAEGLLRVLAGLPGLKVRGLMTVAPLSRDPEESRVVFRELRRLERRLTALGLDGVDLTELSMGMSQDFRVAVEEGATLVRLGTALFGPRVG